MKKLLGILTINNYLLQALLILGVVLLFRGSADYTCLKFCLVCIGITYVLLALNIAHAVRLQVTSGTERATILRTVLRFKLLLAPFFLLNLLLWVLFVGATYNPFLMMLWILVPFGVFYTFSVLFATSVYSCSKLLFYARTHRLPEKTCVLHILLQLIFVADLFDGIYLASLEKTLEKASETI